MKRCGKCGLEKPLDEFHKDKYSSDGKTRNCKLCNNAASKARLDNDPVAAQANRDRNKAWYKDNPDKLLEYRQRKWATNPEMYHSQRLQQHYNLTLDQFLAMMETGNDCCWVCETDEPGGRSGKWFQVDHDHACCPGKQSCGKCVRGILCHRCNTYVVPAVEESRSGDPILHDNVIAYLETYRVRRELIDAKEGV